MQDQNIDNHQEKGIWAWNLVKLLLLVALLLFAGIFLIFGFNETATRYAIRWSAKMSFLLFCLAFSAAGIHYFVKNSRSYWLRMNRKYLGISFALIHLIHLAFLGILQNYFHPVFNKAAITSLLGGGIAYLFVVLMLLTSFPRFSKQLSPPAWAMLHTIGGYWIWTIFMTSYTRRSFTEWEYLPYVVILVLVLIIRGMKAAGQLGWLGSKTDLHQGS